MQHLLHLLQYKQQFNGRESPYICEVFLII